MRTPRKKGEYYYIADLHLFHENLIHPRDESIMEGNMKARKQFSSVDEMHELIRSKWNAKVKNNDSVFILGDLGLYHADEIARFMNSLNGHKHLIIGNHDRRNLENKQLRAVFDTIYSYGIVSDGDEKVVLFHYPIEQWDGYYRGFYHLHGHTHGDSSLKKIPRRYEVSVEVTGYEPMTLQELKEKEANSSEEE